MRDVMNHLMSRPMQKMRARATARRLLVALATAAGIAVVAFPAAAQQVAVIVNGAPITTYDIDQRIRFDTLASHKPPVRQDVIQELIDEKLKVQVGKRYKLEVEDNQVNNAYANMAQRMHLSGDQLTQALAHQGIDSQTLKSKIRADIAWQQIVRGKFQSSLQIREKDVFAELKKKDEKNEVGYEYQLRPILFIVPPGSSQLVLDSRKREAEQLRARFENCNDGLNFARALRDVAIREQIVTSTANLAPDMRKILDGVEVGHLTSPDVTAQGIQMFALCVKKANKLDAAGTKEVRDQMFAAEFKTQAKRYLEELRKQAMIEVK
ncbi:MAG TPA: SurA N-terminal domain-containing protein [Xanthobacteraceae bacterium]|jgi:peptidyl-prolyl cis-trans isomerase SurA